VVPFFGSAALAICRPEAETKWGFRRPFFPFGAELADKLARDSSYYSSAQTGHDFALLELLDAATAAVLEVAPDVHLVGARTPVVGLLLQGYRKIRPLP
jgi:hypothetical protein